MTALREAGSAVLKVATNATPMEWLVAGFVGVSVSVIPSPTLMSLLAVLGALMVADLLVGSAAAWYERRWDGNQLFRRTVAKMTGYSMSLIALYGVFYASTSVTTGSADLEKNAMEMAFSSVVMLLLLHEARSVVLNSAKMDLPILGHVGKWLQRWERRGIDALKDEPRGR